MLCGCGTELVLWGIFGVLSPGAVPVLRLTMAALRADLRADSPLVPGT